MDGSRDEEFPALPVSELGKLTRGSMVKVFDPENEVWYWVVIERRLEDHSFIGRVDAYCVFGPTLRHGGSAVFHEDNILFVWPTKVDPMFDRRWFRIVSNVLSCTAGVKLLKHPTTGVTP